MRCRIRKRNYLKHIIIVAFNSYMWRQISGQFTKYTIPILQEANARALGDQATLHVVGMSLSEPHTYELIGDFLWW